MAYFPVESNYVPDWSLSRKAAISKWAMSEHLIVRHDFGPGCHIVVHGEYIGFFDGVFPAVARKIIEQGHIRDVSVLGIAIQLRRLCISREDV